MIRKIGRSTLLSTIGAASASATVTSETTAAFRSNQGGETDNRISFDWNDGTKQNWNKIEVRNGNPYRYGFSGHVYEFNVVSDNPISGDYSPQIECLNDGVYVQSPDLTEELNEPIKAVSAIFRLEGDLDASDWNNNRFRVNDAAGESNGYVRFDHENMRLEWRGNETEVLEPFEEGTEYEIEITVDGEAFAVEVDGNRYDGLEPREGQEASIHTVEMRSRNWGGTGPSRYSDSVYFTWDEFLAVADDDASEESDPGEDSPDTDPEIRGRLQEANTAARVTIDGRDYLVLDRIPEEPDERLAFTTTDHYLLEPDPAVNVAISYRFCESYNTDNQRRLEYTNEQYEEYGDLESLATVANLLSELSGVVALAKISPASAASNAVDSLQVAVDWGERQIDDPYHEQFARMAAAADAVNWSDEHTPDPGASWLDRSDQALELAETMIGAYQAADAIGGPEGVINSAATVREVFDAADGIRDNVSPADVDGVEDLYDGGFTVLASLAANTVVDSVSGIAEAQTRIAAMGQGQAAARRPLLHELIELEERAREFDIGPAGVIRIHALHQTDYQIEAAGLYGQADLMEGYQSAGLGNVIARVNGTDGLPDRMRELAETWRDLSHFHGALTGQILEYSIEDYSESLNAELYGEQTLLNSDD